MSRAPLKPPLTERELYERQMEVELSEEIHLVECYQCGLWVKEHVECERCGTENYYREDQFADFNINQQTH